MKKITLTVIAIAVTFSMAQDKKIAKNCDLIYKNAMSTIELTKASLTLLHQGKIAECYALQDKIIENFESTYNKIFPHQQIKLDRINCKATSLEGEELIACILKQNSIAETMPKRLDNYFKKYCD